jgi:hypothetical protein
MEQIAQQVDIPRVGLSQDELADPTLLKVLLHACNFKSVVSWKPVISSKLCVSPITDPFYDAFSE